MSEVDIKIQDDKGNELPKDGKTSGNLWVKGPWICKGYMNIRDSEVHNEDGWFLTGDVANIDQDGYMQIKSINCRGNHRIFRGKIRNPTKIMVPP